MHRDLEREKKGGRRGVGAALTAFALALFVAGSAQAFTISGTISQLQNLQAGEGVLVFLEDSAGQRRFVVMQSNGNYSIDTPTNNAAQYLIYPQGGEGSGFTPAVQPVAVTGQGGVSNLFSNTSTTSVDFAVVSSVPPTPVNGACGSSNGQTLASAPTTNLCSAGSASTVSGTGPWTWTCSGSNGGSAASCSANKQGVATNGVCGSSNGQTLASAPTTNLCSAGSASAVSGAGPWTWSCQGANGGSTANCSANAQAVSGACGNANGQTLSQAPVSGLCSTGTASSVTGSGPWNWTCYGSGGGTNASCSANAAVTGGGTDPSGAVTMTLGSLSPIEFILGPAESKYLKLVHTAQCATTNQQLRFIMIDANNIYNANMLVKKSNGGRAAWPTAADHNTFLSRFGYTPLLDFTTDPNGGVYFGNFTNQGSETVIVYTYAKRPTLYPANFNQADTYYVLVYNAGSNNMTARLSATCY